MGWIAALSALEGAAFVALGYIDYKVVHNNPKDIIVAMRKKRLAFAKFSFIMAIGSLFLMDKPSPNAVVPLIIGSGYSAMKMGTQIGFQLTPNPFYNPRIFLAAYNIILLFAVWYKLRQGRREKMDLELMFFKRTENIMQTIETVLSK